MMKQVRSNAPISLSIETTNPKPQQERQNVIVTTSRQFKINPKQLPTGSNELTKTKGKRREIYEKDTCMYGTICLDLDNF